MEINLFQSNQKDTFGIIILSICIILGLLVATISNDLIKFSLVSNFLALTLQIIFAGTKMVIFFSLGMQIEIIKEQNK